MTIYALECWPKDSSASEKLIAFASGIPDDAALGRATPYSVRLRKDFTFDQEVYSQNIPGDSSISIGSLSLNNVDGQLDYLLKLSWGNARVVLKAGPDLGGYAGLVPIFTGLVQEIGSDTSSVTIILRDSDWKLVEPLQKNKFQGSAGKEGVPDLMEVAKPLCFGPTKNLSPVLVDNVFLTYQIHDGSLEAVRAVFDDAVPLTYAGDVSTYATLQAATILPGYFASCKNEGFIRLGAPPAGSLTVDADGEFTSLRNVSAMLKQILLTRTELTEADLNLASFTELAVDCPAPIGGIYYPQPDVAISDFIDSLVGTYDSFQTIDGNGKLAVRRFKFRQPVASIKSHDIVGLQKQVSSKPIWKTTVEYDRNLTILDPSSLSLPGNELVGYISDEIVYDDNPAGYDGTFSVFLGSQNINNLRIVDFQKVGTADWMTIRPDGTFTVTDPGVDNAKVVLRASMNEAVYEYEFTWRRTSGPYIQMRADSFRLFRLKSDRTPVDADQIVRFHVDTNLSGLNYSAVDNLGNAVPVRTSDGKKYVQLSDVTITSRTTFVKVQATSEDGYQTTMTIPFSRGDNNVTAAVVGIAVDVGTLIPGLNQAQQDIINLDGTVTDVRESVDGVKTEVSGIKETVTGITGNVETIKKNVEDLTEVFGDTVSAAISAQVAQSALDATREARDQSTAARDAAQAAVVTAGDYAIQSKNSSDLSESAKNLAEQSSNESQAARDAAQTAQSLAGTSAGLADTARQQAQAASSSAAEAGAAAEQKALESAQSASSANGFAQTASGQASIATQKADAAGQSASVSAAQADIATTEAGKARVLRDQAATSEANALGSANAAYASQTVSATTAAQTLATVASTLPGDFKSDATFWSAYYEGVDDRVAGFVSNYVFNAYGTKTLVLLNVTNPGQIDIANRGSIKLVAGRTSKITVSWRIRYAGGIPRTDASIYGIGLTDTYTSPFTPGASIAIFPGDAGWGVGSGWAVQSAYFKHDDFLNAGCTYMRALFRVYENKVGESWEVLSVSLTDATSEVASKESANASAVSASNAAASENAAGQRASAADQSRVDAQTAKSQAEGYRNQAAQSVTDANGAAATATQQAGVATSARNDTGKALAETFPRTMNAAAFTTVPQNGAFTADPISPSAIVNGAVRMSTYENFIYPYGLWMRGVLPYVSGATYRLTADLEWEAGYPNAPLNVFYACQYNAAGVMTGEYIVGGDSIVLNGNVPTKFVSEVTLGQSDARFIRFAVLTQRVPGNPGDTFPGTTLIRSLWPEDITSEKAAKAAASASAGSAATASSQADLSGQRATAALASQTAAETARSDAGTYANQASSSRDSAAGSAASAATSSGASATAYSSVLTAVGNPYFENGTDGWQGAGVMSFVSARDGRSSLIKTAPGNKVTIVGKEYPITSATQRFKIAAGWKNLTAADARFFVGCLFFDAEGNGVAASDGSGNYPLGPGPVLNGSIYNWIDREVVIGKGVQEASPYGGTRGIPANAVKMRPVMFINYDDTPGVEVLVDYFTVEDVTAAQEAATSANAAFASAGSASASNDAAGQRASAALTAQTNAETARGDAQTYASQASQSRTDAAGSASQAATSAGVSASARDDALRVVRPTLPSDFKNGATFWAGTYDGADTRPPGANTDSRWHFNYQDTGTLLIQDNGTTTNYDTAHLGSVRLVPGRRRRFTIRWRVEYSGGLPDTHMTVYAIGLAANYQSLHTPGYDFYINGSGPGWGSPNGWRTDTAFEFTDDELIAGGAVYVRGLIRFWSRGTAESWSVATFAMEDITESYAAYGFANASSASASSASASADLSGQRASAAETSRSQAAGSAGEALGYRNTTADYMNNAAGSASQASQSAGVAARAGATGTVADWSNRSAFVEPYWNIFTRDAPDRPVPMNVSFPSSAEGTVLYATNGDSGFWATRGYIKIETGGVYRLSGRSAYEAANTTSSYTPYTYFGWAIYNGDGVYIGNVYTYANLQNLGSIIGSDVDLTTDQIKNQYGHTTAVYMRPLALTNYRDEQGGLNSRMWVSKLAGLDVTSEVAAKGSASAASGSAANAAASQSAAGQSASAADGYRNQAQTAYGQADAARAAAAVSESNAAGSANSATTQANLAASALSGAKGVVTATLPSTFDQDGDYWSAQYGGVTTRPSNFDVAYRFNPTGERTMVVNDTGDRPVFDVSHKGITKLVPGTKLRLSAVWRVRYAAGHPSAQATIYFIGTDAQGNAIHTPGAGYEIPGSGEGWGTPNGWKTSEFPINADQLLAVSGVTHVRGLFRFEHLKTAQEWELLSFTLRDVTSEAASQGFASAANTSSASASASADLSGQRASAAEVSRQAAQTAQGGAESARDVAVTARDSAQGSANSAASSALLSAKTGASRGLTPNGEFSGGDTGWSTSGVTYGEWYIGKGYRAGPGSRGSITQTDLIQIDVSRTYRLNVRMVAHGAADRQMYAGVTCLDVNKQVMGNIYIPAIPVNMPGGGVYNVSGEYTGQSGANPTYGHGTSFITGTVYVRPLALMNYSYEGVNSDLAALWLEDITSEKNSRSSAEASNSSASSAASSRDAAGASASAANQSRVDAQAANGSAQGAASAAQGYAAAADASKAQAQSYASLSANFSAGLSNENATYAAWDDASNRPPNRWEWWAGDTGGNLARMYGNGNPGTPGFPVENSPWSYYMTNAVNADAGLMTTTYNQNGGWIVMEGTVQLRDGGWQGSGILVYLLNNAGSLTASAAIDFYSDVDTAEKSVAAGNLTSNWSVRRFKKLMYLAPNADTGSSIRTYAMTNWSGFAGGGSDYKNLAWYRCGWRSASEAEIAGKKALDSTTALTARVTTNEGVIATAMGRLEAYATKEVSAGGATAFVTMRARDNNGNFTSDVGIGASTFSVYNPSSEGWVLAMQVSGGSAVFTGGISATSFTLLNSGQKWRFQFASQTFQRSDNEYVTIPNFGALPNVEFGPCPTPLNAGEVYSPYVENLTNTGFNPRLRISVPGTISAQHMDISYSASGSGPTIQQPFNGRPEAANGSYTISGSVSAQAFWAGGPYDDVADVSVQVDIYAIKSGAWVYVTSTSVDVTVNLNGPKGYKTGYGYFNGTFQLGSGVTGIGATAFGQSGPGVTAMGSFGPIDWQAQGASASTRSATPNGEKIPVIVRPQ